MVDGIVLYKSLGWVAAMLTVFEYFLGIFTALAARACLHGLWLLQLQKDGKTIVSTQSLARRRLWRDIVLTTLGIWLLVAVALVENGLESTFFVSKHAKASKYCMRLDRPIRPQLSREVIPTMDYSVEPWIVVSSQKIVCGPNAEEIRYSSAIGTIGVGGRININGEKVDMYAPSCIKNGAINPSSVKVALRTLRVDSNRIVMVSRLTKVAEIIPYSTNRINQSEMVEDHRSYTEATEGPCISRNISALRTAPSRRWRSRYAQSRRVMQAVHDSICESHPTNLSETRSLRINEVQDCGIEGDRIHELNLHCIRSRIENISAFENVPISKLVFNVQLQNVSFLSFGMDRVDPSYACVDSTVSVQYTVIDHDFFPAIKSTCTPKHPVIVHLGYEVISGHCERTVHALARAALMNSADAEWRKTEFSMLDRIKRYYLFLMSLSSSLYPLSNVDVQPNDVRSPCMVHEVRSITILQNDWTLYFLISALLISILLLLGAFIFRFYFSSSSWEIGSGNWSLEQIQKDDMGSGTQQYENVDLEIVVGPPNRPGNNDDDGNAHCVSLRSIQNETNVHANAISKEGWTSERLTDAVVLGTVVGRSNNREYTLRRVINRPSERNLNDKSI